MDIENSSPPHGSPSPHFKRAKTPSTYYNSLEDGCADGDEGLSISEFKIESEAAWLGRSAGQLHEEKENEKHSTDRFIPLRKHSSGEARGCFAVGEEREESVRGKEVKEEKMTVEQMYRCVLLDNNAPKMLNFAGSLSDKQQQRSPFFSEDKQLIESRLRKKQVDPEYRKIGKVPFKVLDAPNLQDDFYLNLLEWSSLNILSVALDSSLYFWNANNNRVLKFCELAPDSISSLNWNAHGTQIAVGTSKGTIELWDAAKSCRVGEYGGHSARVSSVAWGDGILASGSRDRSVVMRDIRERAECVISRHEGHTQEVCGLKWSFDNNLLASGGNDNKLFLWSPGSTAPISKFGSHCAAVKALAWSPHNHGVLASGGGSADKSIKFWNTLDGSLLDSIDTGSQVCNLMFSKNTKEIVSTHGYSNNEITIWKYPSLQKTATLTGHSSRVLFLAMSPSGETIVTGAGDETLRFWNAFPGKARKESRASGLSSMELR